MTNLDAKVKELFDKFFERKQNLEKVKLKVKRPWETNGQWYNPLVIGGTPVNIQTCDLETLDQVQFIMNLYFSNTYRKWKGFDQGVWRADLEKRRYMITIKEEEAQLKILESRLNAILSPEAIRQMEIDELSKLL